PTDEDQPESSPANSRRIRHDRPCPTTSPWTLSASNNKNRLRFCRHQPQSDYVPTARSDADIRAVFAVGTASRNSSTINEREDNGSGERSRGEQSNKSSNKPNNK